MEIKGAVLHKGTLKYVEYHLKVLENPVKSLGDISPPLRNSKNRTSLPQMSKSQLCSKKSYDTPFFSS